MKTIGNGKAFDFFCIETGCTICVEVSGAAISVLFIDFVKKRWQQEIISFICTNDGRLYTFIVTKWEDIMFWNAH